MRATGEPSRKDPAHDVRQAAPTCAADRAGQGGVAQRPAGPARSDRTAVPELAPGVTRYAEVLLLFLELVPAQITAIDEALTSGELDDARAHAHKLKGGALSLGARALAQAAADVAHALEEGRAIDPARAIDDLRECFARVRPLLQREIARRPSQPPANDAR